MINYSFRYTLQYSVIISFFIMNGAGMGSRHPQDKADQQNTADEYDEIGGKKRHDEPEGIF